MQESKRSCFFGSNFVVFMGILFFASNAFSAVVVTEDQGIADRFTRHTVTGITADTPELPDKTGLIGASYITIDDIDEDGINEILVTSGVGPDSIIETCNGEVVLFTWDGIDKDSWTQTVLNNVFAFPNETIVRDMNGDGRADIVVCDKFISGEAPGGIYYLENQGLAIANPANWEKKTIYEDTTPYPEVYSYHRAYFVDLDGDGDDDVITMIWDGVTTSTLWLENEGVTPYTPHTIDAGGGSLFAMFDIDQDGDLDIVVPQFTITLHLFSCLVLGSPGGSDPLGDSLFWFENPGPAALASDPDQIWIHHTIDNWYTSANPIGKGMEVVISDIDNDSVSELVVSNHNHQNFDNKGYQIWPSGIFYFEIPGLGGNAGDPTVAGDWVSLPIDTGAPDFAYNDSGNKTTPYLDPEVWADTYAVDRRGTFYDQGSPGMVRAGDVTGDGLEDIVVPGDGKGRLYYYEAVESSGGDLTFSRASLYTDLQCMPGEAEIFDLDNDGDMDIVAAIFDTSVAKPYPYTSGSVFFFENTDETLIELASFDVQALNGAVRIAWETAAEIDNAGFNIYRAEDADGDYERINASIIPAEGSVTEGAAYTFTDRTAQNGKTYYYRLQDVDSEGEAKMHEPQSATPRLLYILPF